MSPNRILTLSLAVLLLFLSIAAAFGSSAATSSPSKPVASAPVRSSSLPAARTLAPAAPPPRVVRPLGNSTTFTLPCWAVNLTICVAYNATVPLNPDVIPNAPYLNSTPADYPLETDSITFDVYSEYNLQANWGGSSGELLGPDAYLYLNVTDVEWNGIPWFCACDDSVWHADASQNWAPSGFLWVNQTVSDFITNAYAAPTTMMSHFRYSLTIASTGTGAAGKTAYNFPAGAYVTWSVQSVHIVGGVTFINSTQDMFGGLFSYYIAGAWFYGYGGCITGQPCYPNNPSPSSANCPTGSQTLLQAAFRCNLEMAVNPTGAVTINDNVIVTLRINGTAQNYTGALMNEAVLYLTAYYANGTEYQTTSISFTPFQHWPTTSANVSIPAAYFGNSYDAVVYYLVVYDTYQDELISQNFTEVVSPQSTCMTTFAQCWNATFVPTYLENESSRGFINGTDIPGVPIGTGVNATLMSNNTTIPIESAIIVLYIKFAANNINQSYPESMTRITGVDWYYNIIPLPTNTNVSFYFEVYDVNQTLFMSHWYHYYIPLVATPSGDQGFFYIEVFDNATHTWVTGANVTILGEDGVVNITTVTLTGLCYPNVTGKQFTPQFLAANETYSITMTWKGFQAQGEPANTNSLRVSFYLTHTMNVTKVLQTGPNWLVKQQRNVIFFSLNIPPAPPTFSSSQDPGYGYLLATIGMAAATALIIPVYILWRDIRKRAEAEEKRITL